jgi:tyrosine-protein phosphatase SIW14
MARGNLDHDGHVMRPSRRQMLWGVAALSAGGAGGAYALLRSGRLRNFGVVREGVLFRSGQLSPAGLERVRTVVSLRPVRDADSNPDTWEADVCPAMGARHARAGLRGEGDAGLDRMVEGFLAVMDDAANYPVLVHCLAGRDRSGVACAVYRMEFDRWPAGRAAAEMGEYGFDPGKDAAAKGFEGFVLQYRPRWQRAGPG